MLLVTGMALVAQHVLRLPSALAVALSAPLLVGSAIFGGVPAASHLCHCAHGADVVPRQ
jgi:hypothetical protein